MLSWHDKFNCSTDNRSGRLLPWQHVLTPNTCCMVWRGKLTILCTLLKYLQRVRRVYTHTHTHTHSQDLAMWTRCINGVSQQEATRLVAPLAVETPASWSPRCSRGTHLRAYKTCEMRRWVWSWLSDGIRVSVQYYWTPGRRVPYLDTVISGWLV